MEKKYNVILIGVDTLRIDHLGCYGYARPTSPHINALAHEGMRFDRCFSQAPITAPSFMSIMTSRYPFYHGVISNIGGEKTRGRAYAVDPKIPTLAEILKGAGYRTAAFTDGGNLYDKLGFAKGFDYYSINRGFGKKMALIPEQDIFYWLSENKCANFFLFFHTYAVHSPWSIQPEYQKIFTGGGEKFVFREKEIHVDNFSELYRHELNEYLSLLKIIGEKNNPALIEHIKDLYDGAIAYVDAFVGKLLESLVQLKILDHTIIIFTSDHGEEFMDHGMLSHRQFYNEILRIPLIIKAPGEWNGGNKEDQIVRSIDIFPTILDFLGIKINFPVQGVSLISSAMLHTQYAISE